MRNKYIKYRHKLFGHADPDRKGIVAQFNSAGFNFTDMEGDLEQLSYAFKVLFEKHNGRPLPSFDESKRMVFPYQEQAARARLETEAFLRATQHI